MEKLLEELRTVEDFIERSEVPNAIEHFQKARDNIKAEIEAIESVAEMDAQDDMKSPDDNEVL